MNANILTEFNFLMNHLIVIANQMKASADDFYGVGDYGFYKFLKAEMMEQYEYSGMISKYIRKMNRSGVQYTQKPAPTHGNTSIQALQNILELEQGSLNKINEMLSMEEIYLYENFLCELYDMLNKEFYEIADVIRDMTKITNDPAAIMQYDSMLYRKYKREYHNPNDEECE